MLQRASACLSLLALLSSFPLIQGDASHISGSSLLGVSSVSEILDKFFKNQEMAGRPAPAWKKEAQAMISLVQGMTEIDPQTQQVVDGYVNQILEALGNNTEFIVQQQTTAQGDLELFKGNVVEKLGGLDTWLGKVKLFSGKSKTCRDNVTQQNESFYSQCSDNDRNGGSSSSSMSLLEREGPCPTQCGKPDTFDFELNAEAKATYTCNFKAGQRAKECVDQLRAKVNMTRQTLTNHYTEWNRDKLACEAHMTRCANCNPLWDTMQSKILLCDEEKDSLYDAYCELQKAQSSFCLANETLHTTFNENVADSQSKRAEEHIELEFLKCIFTKYLEIHNFTVPMVQGCEAAKETAADFYALSTVGEITLPAVDASAVPACFGTVSHSESGPLSGMTGLINELKTDNYAQTVSVADHIFAPAAGDSSPFCTALGGAR